MASEPEILFLYDPTASIDEDNMKIMEDIILTRKKRRQSSSHHKSM